MKSFSEVDRSALRALPTPGVDRSYDILSQDDPILRIAWLPERGSMATAETTSTRWTIKRHGFVNPITTLRDASSGKDVARMILHLRNSAVTFADGRAYRFIRKGFLLPAWQFTLPSGAPLIDVECVREESRLAGGLFQVGPPARDLPVLPELLALGWYFIVQSWAEEEAESELESAWISTV